jgi:16S rRNA processing protein RimM
VFGVRGWLRVFSYTRPAENLLDYRPWHVLEAGELVPIAIAALERRGHVLLARIDGLETREAAAGWVGREIFVTRDQLPPPASGEFYWADLIGLSVVNRSGVELGRVARLLETGAHDVLVVRGETERLIPFVRGVHVLEIDLRRGRLCVDWEADY